MAQFSSPSRSPPGGYNNNFGATSPLRLAPPGHPTSSAPRSPSPLRGPSPSPSGRRPSFDTRGPSFEQTRADPARPSFDSQRPPNQYQRGVSPTPTRQNSGPTDLQTADMDAPAANVPDTKTGGSAGMAGVGRRGFQAAVAAAMFISHPKPQMHPSRFPDMRPPVLNIPDTPMPSLDPRAPSPYGSSSHGHGSNHRHGSSHGHESNSNHGHDNGSSHGHSPIRTPVQTRSNDGNSGYPFPTSNDARQPVNAAARLSPPTVMSPSDSTASTTRLAYLETDEDPDSPVNTRALKGGLSPTSAAKRSDHGHDNLPTRNRSNSALDRSSDRERSLSPSGRTRKVSDHNLFDFPKKERDDDAETGSMYSTSSREHTKSGVSLERSLSSPYESTSSPSLAQSTNPTSTSTTHLKVRGLEHPTRSNTSPILSRAELSDSNQPTTRRKTERKCIKCAKKITDGKWIRVDSPESGEPGVLCEYDWKMLYLPKCRRCDKPIEGQAVGSSDGQIKGKYHRDCFNCTTCQKTFPDKSFYVFDGKPFCEYHYHEANNSLCASPRCGLPVEGQCAVAHNGDRYHIEHFVCEHTSGGACKERLNDEYWEIDGLKLCDRHAKMHPSYPDRSVDDDDDRDWRHGIGSDYDDNDNEIRDSVGSLSNFDAGNASFGRAQKRMTRYIDLR